MVLDLEEGLSESNISYSAAAIDKGEGTGTIEALAPCSQPLNKRTYDKIPIHVHMITQVRPRIGIEWKFLYWLSASVSLEFDWDTPCERSYLQLLTSSQAVHVFGIFARALRSIQ